MVLKIVTVLTEREDGAIKLEQHSECDVPDSSEVSPALAQLVQCLVVGTRAGLEVFHERVTGTLVVWDPPEEGTGRGR